MALYVQTNTSSINSQRMLARSTRQLDTSYERLSSGLRINSAKDDAAGLQISNRMASQINGLTQGNRNANDGISMCQVTEGALDEVTSMLQRIRTLAIQSANGTNSSAERIAINEEVQQLITEVKRVGTDTTYGGNLKILGNGVGSTVFQVGSNAYQTISLTMKSLSKLVTVTAAVNIPNSSGTTIDTIAVNTSLSAMTVTSASASQKTIAFMSEVIRQVDSYRAELGAVQNRMESTISNQENVIENVSDARSRIRDVDYAVETANMTQQSIIQQASTTILTQANQKTQIAMNLLQG
ncbi:MAG: flagellin [Succinivibrionaceae bacterium]|nr:flagellin [Succinivibrionaceae bacterium]